MNITDQVLSKPQIWELQELGFDIEKYSSIKWTSCDACTNCCDSGEDGLRFNSDSICRHKTTTPTLTIADIINILPKTITTNSFLYKMEINNLDIYYIDRKNNTGIYFCEKKLINTFFEALKWCIINKHI